jgi:hypothetical protein
MLVVKVPSIQIFEAVWTLTGADLVSIDPRVFVRALQTEFATFPLSAGVEVYKLVRQKIIADSANSVGQPSNLKQRVLFSHAMEGVRRRASCGKKNEGYCAS